MAGGSSSRQFLNEGASAQYHRHPSDAASTLLRHPRKADILPMTSPGQSYLFTVYGTSFSVVQFSPSNQGFPLTFLRHFSDEE